MFTVTGALPNGTPYDVVVDPGGPANRWGVVASWTPDVAALLYSLEGRWVAATPTSSTVQVDPDDAETVLAALYARTRVLALSGQAPDVIAPVPPGCLA